MLCWFWPLCRQCHFDLNWLEEQPTRSLLAHKKKIIFWRSNNLILEKSGVTPRPERDLYACEPGVKGCRAQRAHPPFCVTRAAASRIIKTCWRTGFIIEMPDAFWLSLSLGCWIGGHIIFEPFFMRFLTGVSSSRTHCSCRAFRSMKIIRARQGRLDFAVANGNDDGGWTVVSILTRNWNSRPLGIKFRSSLQNLRYNYRIAN